MRRVDRELERAHALGNTEYGAPGRSLRLGELAARNLASAGGTSRIVDRLAALGLVERRPDPHDRRGAHATLTDVGVRALRELQVTHHRVAREFFLGRLSERDLGRFAELAERVMPGIASSPVWAATEE